MHKRKKITLSVFMSGSGSSIENTNTLSGALYAEAIEDELHFKMGFNGVGIDYGKSGLLFGTGLHQQCTTVVNKVKSILQTGASVELNFYGHSRGAIGGLLIAKMLSQFDSDLVTVNLALLDPVPGNFITTAKLDFAHLTLAKKSMDLTECRNLKNVLALYPHKPLPTIIAHAPLLPTYPANCKVTEEIIFGAHSGAQQVHIDRHAIVESNEESFITLNLVTRFLTKLGTLFSFTKNQKTNNIMSEFMQDQPLADTYNTLHRVYSMRKKPYKRACHAKKSVSIKTTYPATYASTKHRELIAESLGTDLSPFTKLTFNFHPARSHPIPVMPNPMAPNVDEMMLFLNVLLRGMTKKSRQSQKGALLSALIHSLSTIPKANITHRLLKDTLRNALAICLQRDRNAVSPFTTTTSGKFARRLLNNPTGYPMIKSLLGLPGEVRYRDLRAYVVGTNDTAHFQAKHAKKLYQFFKSAAPKESKLFLRNNMRFHLS